MKKQIFFLLFITLLLQVRSYAQQCGDCDIKGISTDPRNPQNCESILPIPVNGQQGSAYHPLNQFFWFPDNVNNHSIFPYVHTSGSTLTNVNSPFWVNTSDSFLGAHAKQSFSDFWPEDGWEVIKVNMGFIADNTTMRQNTLPAMTYMIFYNKYRGIMRFFGMIPNANTAWEIIRFKIEVPVKKENTADASSLDASNTLSLSGFAGQPLDQETSVTTMEVVTKFPGATPDAYFFWFDIPIAYDPCICKNDVAIKFTAEVQQNWKLTIKGILDAQSIQKTVTDVSAQNEEYEKLVFNRVVGAAAATATAIATSGAVIQTSKFTDLLELFSKKPGVNAQDKSKIEGIKKMVTGASEMVFDPGKNVWLNTVSGDTMTNDDWKQLFTGMNNFLSGVYEFDNPTNAGTKTTTSVIGNITATGDATATLSANDMIYLGMPGSKMSKTLSEETKQIDNYNLNPEYPLYNEPLGTFALLKTPTVKAIHKRTIACDRVDPDMGAFTTAHNVFELFLDEDLVYYINPRTNPNWSNTKISASFVIELNGDVDNDGDAVNYTLYNKDDIKFNGNFTLCGDDLTWQMETIRNYNIIKSIENNSDYYITPVVPIDQLKEFMVRFVLAEPYHPNLSMNHFKTYIRFLIEFESKSIGKDGKPVSNTQIFTFPVNMLHSPQTITQLPFPLIDVAGAGTGHIYSTTSLSSNTPIIFHRGLVRITGNLTNTNPYMPIKIYSLVGFEVEPGASVGPGIELIIGYPFGTYPQPAQSSAFVDNYCTGSSSGLQYKAKTFSPSVPVVVQKPENEKEQITLTAMSAKLYPNPSSGIVNIKIWGAKDGDDVSIEVFDLAGKLLYQSHFNNDSSLHNIDLSNFSKGMYQVRVLNNQSMSSKTMPLIITK